MGVWGSAPYSVTFCLSELEYICSALRQQNVVTIMRIAPQTSQVSVVLLGRFNPTIFHPLWFAENKMIGRKEAGIAIEKGIEVVHPELSSFRLDWLQLQVDRTRFAARVFEEPLVRAYDLVVQCFQIMRHTPLSTLGINRLVHFEAGGEEEWHRLGDILAPKEPWKDFIGGGNLPRRGGLRSLTMKQTSRDTGEIGSINIKIEPSTEIKFGVFMEINDHYEIKDRENPTDADEIRGILERRFENSMEYSERIIDHIMGML